MPEIARFYGIIIQMYFDDHPPPHFHAIYGSHSAQIDIEALTIIEGYLPNRALGLVVEWASLHQNELREAFALAESLQHPGKIDPLP